MTRCGGQFDAQCTKQPEHRVISGLGAGRECFVEALAAKAGILRELCHATSAGDVSNRSMEYVGVCPDVKTRARAVSDVMARLG